MHTALMPMMPDRSLLNRRWHRAARRYACFGLVAALAGGLGHPSPASAQLRREAPTSLTDAEFWDFFASKSEPDGSFLSENFVSNETSFQNVIPTLQGSLTPGGVYMGVGPEQNFTYIANLKPRMAIIVDIRRQNAMEHLMYKALFELSPTRVSFVEHLFSRPMARPIAATAPVADLFDAADTTAPSDSAFRANGAAIIRTLTTKHHFALSQTDIASIEHVYRVFYEAGPSVNYGYRAGATGIIRTSYPTFSMLQSATNADSLPMAFLASEANYQSVRDLEGRNLVIPVVGDFAGPKAVQSVGAYLEDRGMTVTAFYLSNVEQYLFQQNAADRFYRNVAALPIDSTSTFIRSVPRIGGMFGGPGGFFNLGGFGNLTIGGGAAVTSYSLSIVDSGGVRVVRTMQDSAGTMVVHVMRDSGGKMVADSTRGTASASTDSLFANRLRGLGIAIDSTPPAAPGAGTPRLPTSSIAMGGELTSGIAPIRTTLGDFANHRLMTYQDVIAMTKTTGWK
ncbi:MAG TPA: hypothetical protein VMH39_02520 [Gemmatimonadaceae bacterium]|nr:hypothetical protein [Gemmatimonadaceae bacterium]